MIESIWLPLVAGFLLGLLSGVVVVGVWAKRKIQAVKQQGMGGIFSMAEDLADSMIEGEGENPLDEMMEDEEE